MSKAKARTSGTQRAAEPERDITKARIMPEDPDEMGARWEVDVNSLHGKTIVSLANIRGELQRMCMMSKRAFRDECMSFEMRDAVYDVILMLKRRSDCQLEWLLYMYGADLICALLRVEAIAWREMEVSGAICRQTVRMVYELLTPGLLMEYVKEDGLGGEEMIVNAWERMLGRKLIKEIELGPQFQEVSSEMKGVYDHELQHHGWGVMPTCVEYARTVGAVRDSDDSTEERDFVGPWQSVGVMRECPNKLEGPIVGRKVMGEKQQRKRGG